MTKLTELDKECLSAAKRDDDLYPGMGMWRPWPGVFDRARQLEQQGLLKEAGTSTMPPHIVYVITDAGRAAIATAKGQP